MNDFINFSVHGKLNVRGSPNLMLGDIIKKFFCFKAVIKNRKNIISISSIVGWWIPLKVFNSESFVMSHEKTCCISFIDISNISAIERL